MWTRVWRLAFCALIAGGCGSATVENGGSARVSTSAPARVDMPSSTVSVVVPSGGTAELIPLPIVDEPPPNAYSREEFGGWIDADRDCQRSRSEVLIAESTASVTFTKPSKCTVATGKWLDPWSGIVTTSAKALDVDHTVPLANAWRSGAWQWDRSKRVAFANELSDPNHLIAIPLGENRSKGDRGPEGWRPPAPSAWCRYAHAWTAIKAKWGLSAVTAEWRALVEMAASC